MSLQSVSFRKLSVLSLGFAVLCVSGALAEPPPEGPDFRRPSLIITNGPLPESLRSTIYNKPVQVREITPAAVVALTGSPQPMNTIITGKVDDLASSLSRVQSRVQDISGQLDGLQKENQEKAADYFAAIASVNTQLQSGTTPGNPRLLEKLNTAEQRLEDFSGSANMLNQIGQDASQVASENTFLLQEARAAYGLSGAVEEDHLRLTQIEDDIFRMSVLIDRILNSVTDDLTRTNAYLSSERENVRALSLAVANGEMYGRSLSNRPFSNVPAFTPAAATSGTGFQAQPAVLSQPRALVKIKFDRPDVAFEQPVYMAVNEALNRYPSARFSLVAVHPAGGNAAQVAIESTRARRNAENVLRVLTEMGLPLDRVDLSYSESASATTNEVHLYVQ
ncbi:MAG: hypothetical protein K9G62_01595 [Alphaproteobacteria bacterium]|nr:hypothetical protein [Alphaproteobacteria bacterium]